MPIRKFPKHIKKSLIENSDLIVGGIGAGMFMIGSGGIIPLAMLGAGTGTRAYSMYKESKKWKKKGKPYIRKGWK